MKNTLLILLGIAILIAIFVVFVVIMTRTDDFNSKGYAEEKLFAQLIMPDGSIISGECTRRVRISSGYMLVTIDGIEYQCNELRIVLWTHK